MDHLRGKTPLPKNEWLTVRRVAHNGKGAPGTGTGRVRGRAVSLLRIREFLP